MHCSVQSLDVVIKVKIAYCSSNTQKGQQWKLNQHELGIEAFASSDVDDV